MNSITSNPLPTEPVSTSTSDRRQRRSADIRERLFRAALQLFAEKGLAETTVEDITEAADVGKGTFFNYFPSKDHLLLAFGEMQVNKLQGMVDNARETGVPMRDFLSSLSVRMTEEHMRNPAMARALLQAYLSTTPIREAMTDIQRRSHALHTEMIQLGQQRGEIRTDIPAAEIVDVFRQTIFGTLLIWSLYGDATLTARMEAAVRLLWTGMAAREQVTSERPAPLFT